MAALAWYAAAGATVCVPVGHTPAYDFVADLDGRVLRVQVKTSTYRRGERWEVATCTRGGNRSWNGLIKRLDACTFDELFVVVAGGRRWRIPAPAVDGRGALLLGGPKWAAYEVGDPEPSVTAPLLLT
jgi:hypothetical protein